MVLTDTDVLIEVRKGSESAGHWLASLGQEPLVVPGIVAMEFINGSRNKAEMESADRFVSRFSIYWPTESDARLAFDLIRTHRLQSGTGLSDFMIAAQAIHLGATLYTFNIKHFRNIPGLDARPPYAR
ncbi:type II toxin-antitoxin system VapC family toxin [bacterium]|nr:MAG: type II toxin-antitoxin system VapC family toxin [bacterium]